jgi:uncharacterized membrane protein HdeD (DUF308 family)
LCYTGLVMPENNVPVTKTAAIVWWVCFVLFGAGMFTPFFTDLFNMEHSDWVFATMFFCIVLCATSLIAAIMYTKRYRTTVGILCQENLLAHWVYTPEEWSHYAKKEHREFKQYNKQLFLLVGVIAVIIGIIFIIAEPEDWSFFVFIILGIIVIAGGSAWLAVALKKRQDQKYTGEVYITNEAIYINRVLHTWKGFGASLDDVIYHDSKRPMPILQIDYSTPGRYSRNTATVRVPVPPGHEAEAQQVFLQLYQQVNK